MVRDLIRLLRPHQWTKNVLCLAGAVFAGKQLLSEERLPQALLLDLAVFGIFCIASSATYIFNDIADRKRDRRHPKKRLRPIPSGAVPLSVATALAKSSTARVSAPASAAEPPKLALIWSAKARRP